MTTDHPLTTDNPAGAPIPLGDDTWRIEVGVANVGWLPTTVSALAAKQRLVLPLVVELMDRCRPLEGSRRLPDGLCALDGDGGEPTHQLVELIIEGA